MLDRLDRAKNLVDIFHVSSSHLEKSKQRGLRFPVRSYSSPRKPVKQAPLPAVTRSNSVPKPVPPQTIQAPAQPDLEKTQLLGQIEKLNERLDKADHALEERILNDPVLSQLAVEFGKANVIDQVRKGNLRETPKRNLEEKFQFLAAGPLKSEAETLAQSLNAKLDAFDAKHKCTHGDEVGQLTNNLDHIVSSRVVLSEDLEAANKQAQAPRDYQERVKRIVPADGVCFDTLERVRRVKQGIRKHADTKLKYQMPLLGYGERPQGLELL